MQGRGGETGAFWRRPLKTPALPCSPAIPGRADGWAGNDHPVVSFPTTGGWQQWLPLVAAIMAPCGHLAASSHAGRARGPAGEQNRAGANLGISTPGRRGATSGWKEEADAPRLFDANHSVLVLARGAPITKTEGWQEDGQERRTGTETSGGGFPLVQQPLCFHPWLVLLWDDDFPSV